MLRYFQNRYSREVQHWTIIQGEIHRRDAEILILPPAAVQTDQNALEQQLNKLHSLFTVIFILHIKCNTFRHLFKGLFRNHPGKCMPWGRLRESGCNNKYSVTKKTLKGLNVQGLFLFFFLNGSPFLSMQSINISGKSQACKQLKETHLRMA